MSGIFGRGCSALNNRSHHEYVEAYISFGCGQVQSGSFLDIAASNGLFGLGMEKMSVPSILSREGFTLFHPSSSFGKVQYDHTPQSLSFFSTLLDILVSSLQGKILNL